MHHLPNENIFINNTWIPIDSQIAYIGLDIQKGYIFDSDSVIIHLILIKCKRYYLS